MHREPSGERVKTIELEQLGITAEAIVEGLVERLQDNVWKEVEGEVRSRIDKVIDVAVTSRVAALIESMATEMLDFKFTETTDWGERKSVHTVRERITKEFEQQCTYKRNQYSSDKNAFSKIFDKVLEEMMADAKKTVLNQLNESFTKACFDFARDETMKKLGVK